MGGAEHCTDPVVAQEVRQFIGQEAQHFRQRSAQRHDPINQPELEGLREIEDQLEADYQSTNTKSLKFNLAMPRGLSRDLCRRDELS